MSDKPMLKYPEIFYHPINQAAIKRLESEGMSPPSNQELPIIALAREYFMQSGCRAFQEGNEDSDESIALVALDISKSEVMRLMEELFTPDQILDESLEYIADSVLSELMDDLHRDNCEYLWDKSTGRHSADIKDDSEQA